MGHSLESSGCVVIPCGGKSCIDRPAAIFSVLGIPTYLVWDSDKGKDKPDQSINENRRLLRLLDETAEDWPTRIEAEYACFEVDLETTLSHELGQELFDQLLIEQQTLLGIPKRKHAIKNPVAIAKIIDGARKATMAAKSLEEIVTKIVELRRST